MADAGSLLPLEEWLHARRPRLLEPVAGYGERLRALAALSDSLLKEPPPRLVRAEVGLPFLTGFLRRDNLEHLIARELPRPEALERFAPLDGRKRLRLVPRGVACHWIAGNVPLLGVFSWALSALVGNLNVVRLSSAQEDFLSPLLGSLASTGAAGAAMRDETLVRHFARDDREAHAEMSRVANLRVVWGGAEALEAVRGLPTGWDTEDLVLGPRLSLSVVDPALATDRVLARLVTDIVYFDQQACSSPQQLFVRGQVGSRTLREFVDRFAKEFERQALAVRRHPLDFGETYQVQRDRARVLLGGGRVERDDATQWTIAVVSEPHADVHGVNRFLQVVPFESLDEIAPHIPANVQSVVTLLDSAATEEFSERAARHGVCRFPRPGEGNAFELPWDGLPFVARLCRWVLRTDPRDPPSRSSEEGS